jgi:hypothetical protein
MWTQPLLTRDPELNFLIHLRSLSLGFLRLLLRRSRKRETLKALSLLTMVRIKELGAR